MNEGYFRFYQILTYVDIVIFLVLTVFLVLNIKKMPLALKIFSYFEFVMFAIGLVSLIMAKLSISNTLLFHLFFFVQFMWISTFYYFLLEGNVFSKVVLSSTGVFLGIAVWQYIANWAELTSKYGGLLYFISTLIFIAFAILFYFKQLTQSSKSKYPLINAAIVIYFSTTSVIFLFSKYYYLEGSEGQIVLWILNVLLHIIFVLLIFVDIWKTLYPAKRTL